MNYLDELAKIPGTARKVYGDDFNKKPNNDCVWTNIGFTVEYWCWLENDHSFRNRLNLINKKESE